MKPALTDRLKGFQWHKVKRTYRSNSIYKNWRYPQKLTFTATEGLAGVPVLVLGHSEGTVGP